jgi:hypothetical protein
MSSSTNNAAVPTSEKSEFRTVRRNNYQRGGGRGGRGGRGGFNPRFQRPQYNAASTAPATSEEKKKYPTEPNFAVTRNGALALYNVMRRPIVFYANQWEGIRAMIENGALTTSLNENADKLRRPPKREESAGAASAEAAAADS